MDRIEKTLKIGYCNQVRSDGWQSEYKQVPKVQLSGAWLREIGFDTGGKVKVTAEDGKIILERLVE